MKKGPPLVFRILGVMFLVFAGIMLAMHFNNDGNPSVLSAVGPLIMSIAMFTLSFSLGRSQK